MGRLQFSKAGKLEDGKWDYCTQSVEALTMQSSFSLSRAFLPSLPYFLHTSVSPQSFGCPSSFFLSTLAFRFMPYFSINFWTWNIFSHIQTCQQNRAQISKSTTVIVIQLDNYLFMLHSNRCKAAKYNISNFRFNDLNGRAKLLRVGKYAYPLEMLLYAIKYVR